MTKPSQELLRRAREQANIIEKHHGHCCGDVIELYADDLTAALVQFGVHIVRECIEIAAERGTFVASNIRKKFLDEE